MRAAIAAPFLLAVPFLFAAGATGQSLVRDIRTGPPSSYRSWMVASGRHVFFIADDGVHGEELWVTDGTAAGTRLVRDANLGPGHGATGPLVPYRDGVLF